MAVASRRKTRTMRDVVRVWFYWKIPAIAAFCIIVASICLYVFTATPMYESQVKLMILPKPQDETVISPGMDSRQYLARPVGSEDINTEVMLIRSDTVLRNTINYFVKNSKIDVVPEAKAEEGWFRLPSWLRSKPLTIDEKRVKALLGSLSVDPLLSSNIIVVSLRSPYKDQVAVVLEKLIENYLTYRRTTFNLRDKEIFFEGQKNYYEEKLKNAVANLKQFNEMWSIVNMQSQVEANLALIAQFQKQFRELDVAILENEAKIRMLENGFRIEGDNFVISKEMRSMPVIVELAKGLVPLLIKRTEISKTFTKDSREYQQIDAQIRMLRQEIKNETMSITRTNRLENKGLMIKRDLLRDKLAKLKEESKEFQNKQESHKALELEVELARQNFLKYGEKRENTRMFAKRDESNLSNIVVAEPPNVPNRPKYPNKMLAIQVAIFLGFFAALVLPFLLETLDHKLKTSDDVENALQIPVVCTFNEV